MVEDRAGPARGGYRIKRQILLPFFLVLLVATGAFITVAYLAESREHSQAHRQGSEAVQQLFRHNLDLYARMTAAILPAIAGNPGLKSAFLSRERSTLQARSHALFRDLAERHRITHFYFHGPDLTNFLRVHQPERHGDAINRQTATKAANKGELVSGLELGPLGTLTLRTVQPWYGRDENLIGYLELGVEVDHILQDIHQILDTEIMVVIRKEVLDRAPWESGMRMLNRRPEWDRLPDEVVVTSTLGHVPNWMANWLTSGLPANTATTLRNNSREYSATRLPLSDMAGRAVGSLVTIDDTTHLHAAFENKILQISMVAIFGSMLVFALFFVFVERAEGRLGDAYDGLEQIVAERTKELRHENLERLRIEKGLRDGLATQNLVASIARLSLRDITLEEVLQGTLNQILSNERLRFHSAGSIFLASDDGSCLRMVADRGLDPRVKQRCATVPMGTCLCGRAGESGMTIFASNLDDRHEMGFEGMAPHGHYCVPIQGDGKVLGLLNIYLPADQEQDEAEERFLAIVADTLAGVIQRHNASQELRQTLDHLAKSNAELERFAYVAAHDLQEPVRSVITYSQLLGKRYGVQLDREANEYLDFIVSGSRRMGDLIRDLLAYSRVSSTVAPFSLIDTGVALNAAIDNLDRAIKESGAEVSIGTLPTIRGDMAQIVELFQNLLHNSIKFSKPDQKPEISIGAKRNNSEWQFTVSDNGIGIDHNYLEQIFVIFKRLHTIDAFPGTGVGLAICNRIVERHHGRIWAESEPGKGTVVSFSLPATLTSADTT